MSGTKASGHLHLRFEQMRMIGWADSMFANDGHHLQDSDFDYVELLGNMAGNAWSVFHYAPVQVHCFTFFC